MQGGSAPCTPHLARQLRSVLTPPELAPSPREKNLRAPRIGEKYLKRVSFVVFNHGGI